MIQGYVVIATLILLAATSTGAADPPPAGNKFTVGIELQSQVPVPAPVENALKDIGIGYAGFYVANTPKWEKSEAETMDAMTALCKRLGLQFSLDCHHRDPAAASIAAASSHGSAFQGVLVDELTHIRLLYPEFRPPEGDAMLADPTTFHDFEEAEAKTLAGLIALNAKYRKAGAPRAIATEVWPSLLHLDARAGMTPCPKICKEFYSPVSLAIGMGAALEYNRDLWVDVDMWYFATVPGHTPEEVRTNLEFAYWMGADLVYLEGCGYNLFPAGNQGIPFSLMTQVDAERYQLTPHGAMLKDFCRTYLPSHPRPWTFRDVRPDIAIVRFDDTDVGQKSWGVQHLYGSNNLKPDRDTAAWLGLWNVLTHGKTGADGLAWFKPSVPHPADNPHYHKDITPSYLSEKACEDHSFFVPLNGAIVFDHLVAYDRLKNIPLIVLTGRIVSEATRQAIDRCVAEGATCVAWGPLAAKAGIADWTKGIKTFNHGKGRYVITDDFQSPETLRYYHKFIGKPDEIKYRFGDQTLTMKRITDNSLKVDVNRVGPS